jgi:hypothetical protein
MPRFSMWVCEPDEWAARLVRVEDWGSIVGGEAYVVQRGVVIRHGIIESTTSDDCIAWVAQAGPEPRQLVDKSDDHELWVDPRHLQQRMAEAVL